MHPFSCQKVEGTPVRVCYRSSCFFDDDKSCSVVPDTFTVIRISRVRKTDIERRFATGNDPVLRLAVHANRRFCNPEGIRNATVCITVPVRGLDALCEAMGRFRYVYLLYEVPRFRIEPRAFTADGDKETAVFCVSIVLGGRALPIIMMACLSPTGMAGLGSLKSRVELSH